MRYRKQRERLFRNVRRPEQRRLAQEFVWLPRVCDGRVSARVHVKSISVFDHWLDEAEARVQLANVGAAEQARRDARHAALLRRIVSSTPVLSFALRGRRADRVVFRRFRTDAALDDYIDPAARERFRLLLPELGVAYFRGWDDTNTVYVSAETLPCELLAWVSECGLHVLA